MSTHIIIAVRDSAVGRFAPPAAMPSASYAIRSFAQQVNTPDANSQLYNTPQDFELWQLATWNEETGLFENVNPPVCIARAIDHKEKQNG